MKRVILSAAFLLAACQPAPPQEAVMEALSAEGCSSGGDWCVTSAEGGAVDVRHGARSIFTMPAVEGQELGAWPHVIRYSAGGREYAIIGVTRTVRTMYSGGGGSATHVELYVVGDEPRADPHPAFVAPLSGQLDIRACFSEADMERLGEACANQYDFTGEIAVGETQDNDPPTLTLTTQASTFPAGIGRETDNRREFTAADLVETPDPTCSYTRTLAYNIDSGQYVPNEALPSCVQYLEP